MAHGLKQLNDAVYLAQKGDEGRRVPQIVFIHGLQVQENKNLYFETWLSADGRDLWPKIWLSESFPSASIYLVHYDSCTWKDERSGRMDMFLTAENLLQNLLLASIGQSPRNPVILVGQDVGGLVIKEICLQAYFGTSSNHNLSGYLGQKKRLFLKQVKGIFYFSTPHGGLHHWDQGYQGELMKTLMVHNAEIARTNEAFRKMRSEYKWSAYGLGASLPGMVEVKEAAGRVDVDDFCMIDADTMNICRPKDRTSSSYLLLEEFIQVAVSGFTNPDRPKLPFKADVIDRYVPLKQTVREVREKLEDPDIQVVVLCGDAGTGKSSLVKYLALQFEEEMGSQSPFWDGIFYFEGERGLGAKTVLRKVLREIGVNEEKISQSSSDDEDRLRFLLKEKLENLNALMIFDDVWDDDRKPWVEKVVVPQAKEVKYLLISQQSDGWSGYSTCKIENIDLNTAQEIIVKQVGLRDNKIPEYDKEIIDEIILAADFHPLALATISNSVEADSSGRVHRADWEDLRQNLVFYLREDDAGAKATAFGKSYPRSVFAAMMNAVDLLCTRKDESLHLMCIMALFKSPFPTSVVHMFMLCTVPPQVFRQVYRLTKRLVGRQLVQRASSARLIGQVTCSLAHASTHVISVPRLMMHSLRQRFIRICAAADYDLGSTSLRSVEVIKKILAPFLSETDDVWPHEKEGHFNAAVLSNALCALYGVDEVKKEALRKLYNYQLKIRVWNVASKHEYSRTCLEMLMRGIEEHSTSTNILSALQKAVWRYICELQVDDDNVSFLISGGYECAVNFLEFHVTGLGSTETSEVTSKIPRSLVAAVSLLRDEMHLNDRNLTVVCLLQHLAFCTMADNPANIHQLVNDILDLEVLIDVLHSVRNSALTFPSVLIQILGTLAQAPSVKSQVIALLLSRPDVQEAINSVRKRLIVETNGDISCDLLESHGHMGENLELDFCREEVYGLALIFHVNTVLMALKLLCELQTLGEETVIATVQSISKPLQTIASSFRPELGKIPCLLGLKAFDSIPLKKDQTRRLIIWCIPGAIEGIVSVVRRIQQQPEDGAICYALTILDTWTRADDEVRSWLFTHEGFLEVLVEVIGSHRGELNPVAHLLGLRSAVRLFEQFVTSDGEAASALVFLPRLHHVLSDLLRRHADKNIQKSALTVLLYLGYKIGGTNDMSLQPITSEHLKGEVTESVDLAAKVQGAFESLFSVIDNNGQRATQVAALEVLNHLLVSYLSARTRFYAMPTTAILLAKLLHEDDPLVQEKAVRGILLLAMGFQYDAANGFMRQIALIPGALEKLVEFMGYDWTGRDTAMEYLYRYLKLHPESSSRMLAVGTVIRDMVVSLQNKHQPIHEISATLFFLRELYRESRNLSSFLCISGSVEALVELLADSNLEEQSGLALQRVRGGSGAESLHLTHNCLSFLFNLATQSKEAISRMVATGRVSDLMIELFDRRQPKEVQMLAVQFLSYLATPSYHHVVFQVMERPDFVEKFSLLLHNADPAEQKIHVMSLAFSLASVRRSLPEKIIELVSGALQESVDLLTSISGPQELVPQVLWSLSLLVEYFRVARPFIIRASGAIETLISWSIHCEHGARMVALQILRLTCTTVFQDTEFTPCLLRILEDLPEIVDQLGQRDSVAEQVSVLQFLKPFVVFAWSGEHHENTRTRLVRIKLMPILCNPQVLQNLAALLQIDEPQHIHEDVMFILGQTAAGKLRILQISGALERVVELACRGNSDAFFFLKTLISIGNLRAFTPRYLLECLVRIVYTKSGETVASEAIQLLGLCARRNRTALHWLIDMLHKSIRYSLRAEAMNFLINHASDHPVPPRRTLLTCLESLAYDPARDGYLGHASDFQKEVLCVLVSLVGRSIHSQLRVAKYMTGLYAHDLQIHMHMRACDVPNLKMEISADKASNEDIQLGLKQPSKKYSRPRIVSRRILDERTSTEAVSNAGLLSCLVGVRALPRP